MSVAAVRVGALPLKSASRSVSPGLVLCSLGWGAIVLFVAAPYMDAYTVVATAVAASALAYVCWLPLWKAGLLQGEWSDVRIYLGAFTFLHFGIGTVGVISQMYTPVARYAYIRTNATSLQGVAYSSGIVIVGLLAFFVTYRHRPLPAALLEAVRSRRSGKIALAALVVSGMAVWSLRAYEIENQLLAAGYGILSREYATVETDILVQFTDALGWLSVVFAAIVTVILPANNARWRRVGWAYWLAECIFQILLSRREYLILTVFRFWLARAALQLATRRPKVRILAWLFAAVPIALGVQLAAIAVRAAALEAGEMAGLDFSLWGRVVDLLVKTDGVLSYALEDLRWILYRISSLDTFLAFYHETESRGLLWGETFVRIVPLALIPRFLWLSKPELIGSLSVEGFIRETYGLRPSFDYIITPTTELYVNFGVVGVAVGMSLLGLLLGVLRTGVFWLSRRGNFLVVAVWLAFLPQLIKLESNSVSVYWAVNLRNVLLGLLIALLMWMVIDVRSRRGRGGEA